MYRTTTAARYSGPVNGGRAAGLVCPDSGGGASTPPADGLLEQGAQLVVDDIDPSVVLGDGVVVTAR